MIFCIYFESSIAEWIRILMTWQTNSRIKQTLLNMILMITLLLIQSNSSQIPVHSHCSLSQCTCPLVVVPQGISLLPFVFDSHRLHRM